MYLCSRIYPLDSRQNKSQLYSRLKKNDRTNQINKTNHSSGNWHVRGWGGVCVGSSKGCQYSVIVLLRNDDARYWRCLLALQMGEDDH